MGAHLAKRLATAAREGPGTGTAESRDATHEIVAAVKELTPWSALLHGVAQCEVTSRPCEPTGEGSATDPAPPPAASAAVTGRWRALRELARLALVGDKAGNCEEGACERFGELDVLLEHAPLAHARRYERFDRQYPIRRDVRIRGVQDEVLARGVQG